MSVYSLRKLLEDPKILEPPEAIIPRLMFKGRRTVLAGREKLGKSTLLAQGVASVSSGGVFLGEQCNQATILWVGLEEKIGDTVVRFEALGADPDRVHIMDSFEGKWDAHIYDYAKEVGASGVIIDSYAMLLSHLGVKDENDAGTANVKLFLPLAELVREGGLSIVFSAHSRREDGRYRGSSALGGGVDLIVEMFQAKSSKTERTYECRGRVPTEDFSTDFDGEEYSLTQGTLSLRERVLNYIEKYPHCSTRNIREAVGGNSKVVGSTLKQLADQRRIFDYGSGRAHKWKLLAGQTEIDPRTANGSAGNPVEPRTEPPVRTTTVPDLGGKGSEVGTTTRGGG